MRTPTPLGTQLAWWRAALAGEAIEQGSEECLFPQPGYYKIRAKAWSKTWLPARVWLQQEIDWETGELTSPVSWQARSCSWRRCLPRKDRKPTPVLTSEKLELKQVIRELIALVRDVRAGKRRSLVDG